MLGVTSAQTCLVLKGRLRALRDAGFRVTVLSSPGELLNALAREENAESAALPMARSIAPVKDVCALFRLWLYLRRLRPDIVEFSTPKAGLLGMIAARLAGVPRRVYLLRGLKLETARGLKRVLLQAAEWLAMTCAQTVLCNSPSLRDKAQALRLANVRKLRVLGAGSSIGVDFDHFMSGRSNIRYELGIPEESMVIGYTGRLTRDKGIPELIEAFEAIRCTSPEAHLLLVGWWDQSEDALNAAQRERILNHPYIRCTGFVSDAAPYLRAMDIFVLPSFREGFPNAVLEASATELPVITTDATGARDAVIPEITGVLVPAGSSGALKGALLRLLGDAELRRQMGVAGRRWVREKFGQQLVLAHNVRFYLDQLQAVRRRPEPEQFAMAQDIEESSITD